MKTGVAATLPWVRIPPPPFHSDPQLADANGPVLRPALVNNSTALQTYAGPIVVTLAYLLLYYFFQVRQARTKFKLMKEYRLRGDRFDRYFTQDRVMLAVDRTMLNTLEHMPPFLVLLWLHAMFVGPRSATLAGAVYVVARATYPLLVGRQLSRSIPNRVLISTVTGYVVLAYMVGTLGWAVWPHLNHIIPQGS